LPATTRSSTSRSRGVSESSREHPAASRILLERLVDPVEQVLVAERLLDEVNRAGLHRLDRHRHVAMSGDEDDRQDRVVLVQLLLQLESAHARHADVEHQAARVIVPMRIEELLRRLVHFDGQANRLEQHPERVANCGVVIDDENGWLRFLDHSSSPVESGEAGTVK
jgi:hypothetical protein